MASRSSSSYRSHLPRYLKAGTVSMVVLFTVKVVARMAGWSCASCLYSLRAVPRLHLWVSMWLGILQECRRHFGQRGRYPSSRIMRWLYGWRWLKWEHILDWDVIGVAHLGMGQLCGMVGSGIDVM